MRAVRLVALAVFRESIRDRVPLTIVGFGVLLVAASYLIGQMTAGQDLKITKDLGLAALNLLGLLIAVFIGIGLVAKEVERRSIYSLLSRPLTREQFILGKFTGLLMTLAVNLAAMIADPSDLVGTQKMDPADVGRRSIVLTKYRNGEKTSSERSDDASGAISKAVGN